jgi:hypothetical protein
MSPKLTRTLFILTFVISAALRLGLSLVNREANDPHMEVVQYMLTHGNLPTRDDCWECFQPKLYHVLVTGILKAGNITDPNAQILAANLFSFVVGLLTLAVVWRFLMQLPIQNDLLRWLAFAFTAFNPKLIGINSQATNDTLLIFFSTLALYQAWLFLQTLENDATAHRPDVNVRANIHSGLKSASAGFVKIAGGFNPRQCDFALLALWVVLAASTKTNGWVVFIAILLTLLLRAIFDLKNRLRLETYLLAYLVIVPLLVTFNPLNQYLVNNQKYGTPLVVNINRAPPPSLFTQTSTNKPGILSIQDGFFTFKFASLLATPYINYDPANPLPHRTSFWTQLYGRAHSVNFDNWPGTWRSDAPSGFFERRAIYILALIPTTLLLIGAGLEAWKLLHKNDENCLFLLACLGYIGFVALYAFIYREYPVMKAVFTYPALPAFSVLFITAASKLPKWALQTLTGLSIILFVLYAADVVSLTVRLISFL